MAFKEYEKDGVVWLQDDAIKAPHAFTTRYGGVSRGIWSSMNLGENRGDDPKAVEENYRIICRAAGLSHEELVFTRQIHGKTVRPVTREDKHVMFAPVPYDADGLVTDERGLTLVAFSADCIPILLWDGAAGAVGAVHAGWRGTVADIAGEAVEQMVKCYGCRPENIYAAIGPGIGRCCFETDWDVPQGVMEVLGEEGHAFIFPEGAKYYVDIKGVNKRLLERRGMPAENISVSDECTKCHNDKYWSARCVGSERGSQAALIMLPV